MIGWVLFRASDVKSAFGMYAGMVGQNGFELSDTIQWQITNLQYFTLFASYAIIFTMPFLMNTGRKIIGERTWAYELSFVKQLVVDGFSRILISNKIIFYRLKHYRLWNDLTVR